MSIRVVLVIGMSISIVYGIMDLLKQSINHGLIWGLSFIFGLIIYLLFLSKKTRQITISVFFLGGSVGGIYDLWKGHRYLLKLNGQIYSYIEWLRDFFGSQQVENLLYESILSAMILGITMLVITFLTLVKKKYLLVIFLGSVPYLISVIKKHPLSIGIVIFFIIMGLCYYGYDYYLKLRSFQTQKNTVSSKDYFEFLATIIVITLVLSITLTYTAPLKVSLAHLFFNKKTPQWSYNHMSYFPYTGTLGGDINLKDTHLLDVEGPRPTYLKVQSHSEYTGTAWKSLVRENDILYLKDSMSEFKAMPKDKSLFYEDTFYITFQKIRTKTLFIPKNTYDIKFEKSINKLYINNAYQMILPYDEGIDFTYRVEAYTPKYKEEALHNQLRKSKVGKIDSIYLKLPQDIPKRIKTLALDITEDMESDYDKACALETYLSTYYTYTQTPGPIQEESDFVDQFLFESPKGYCTYFASAMAVLGRSIGLPTRYVQGYVTPRYKAVETNKYPITGKHAHAWVEIYFEDFGWMIFDPTPGYNHYLRGTDTKKLNEEIVEDRTYDRIPIEEQTDSLLVSYKELKVFIKRLAISVLAGIILCILILSFYIRHKKREKNSREEILECYQKCLKRLRKKGLIIRDSETYTQYAKRVDDTLEGLSISFKKITKIFLKARFSQLEILEEEKADIVFFKQLLKGKNK